MFMVFNIFGIKIHMAEAQTSSGLPDGCTSGFGYSATTGEACDGSLSFSGNLASDFPDGCASGLGYSATTGKPCNGESTPTERYVTGCNSALGYSSTDGAPCSGGNVALNWLLGCTSTFGYSSISGEPCNGTDIASLGSGGAPGLPTTGFGGDVLQNILLLLFSAGIMSIGGMYLYRNYKKAQS